MKKPNLCFFCKWNIDMHKCKAYDKIPEEIVEGIVDHRNPYKGDGGIHFEPAPICPLCYYYTGERTCYAFSVIPQEIWTGEFIHTKPYEGDRGIRFKFDERKLLEAVGPKKPIPDEETIRAYLETLKYIEY